MSRNLWIKKLLLILGTLFLGGIARAEMALNMTRGVTPLSHQIYDLHMLIFWICVVIGTIVFGALFYALLRHRKSGGHTAAKFHSNATLEITWAVIPFIILVLMAIPATKVLFALEDTRDAVINIKVTGYQWKWKYDYLDEGISFFSILSTPIDQIENKAKKNKWYLLEVDKPVVVPINKKIRFLLTSNDVIHSWWVPQLGMKRDAVPGFINEMWAIIEKPGTYRGQCAELCGMHHGFMPIVVIAKSNEDYQKWVSNQHKKKQEKAAVAKKVWTKADLMAEGKNVYEKYCGACHQLDGTGLPPAFPSLLKDKSPMVKGPVKDHINMVVNGKTGTAMQAFASQLNDAEIAAVVTYERNAWGNDTGDVVQPKDITKFRKK